jgi:hypothetical protein
MLIPNLDYEIKKNKNKNTINVKEEFNKILLQEWNNNIMRL